VEELLLTKKACCEQVVEGLLLTKKACMDFAEELQMEISEVCSTGATDLDTPTHTTHALSLSHTHIFFALVVGICTFVPVTQKQSQTTRKARHSANKAQNYF
jgi:hypothetical protein